MPRDFLNQGIHIADLNVAAGAVPQAAPTLATHGYPTAQTMGSGNYVDLPLVLAVIDFDGGASPTATLNLWGYAQPPAAGATLISDWQQIDSVTVSDSVGANPTFALIPCAGFLRFDVKVQAITGAPTSVRIRLIGTTHYTQDLLVAAGAVAGVASNVNIIEISGNPVKTTSISGTLPILDEAFDIVTYSNKATNLNTSATDNGYFLIAQEVNITQPAVQYYPSASGHALGNRKNIGITLRIEDITSVAFQVTNDPTLTYWEDITASVTDPNTGLINYASTHWTEPGSGTPVVRGMALDKCEFTRFRLAVVGSAAANTFEAYGQSGAL